MEKLSDEHLPGAESLTVSSVAPGLGGFTRPIKLRGGLACGGDVYGLLTLMAFDVPRASGLRSGDEAKCNDTSSPIHDRPLSSEQKCRRSEMRHWIIKKTNAEK